MTIAPLDAADLPALLDLYRELLPVENSLARSEEIYRQMVENPDYLLLGAKQDGVLLGSVLGICCHCLAFRGQPFLVVEDVIVREASRGQNVGRRLMEALDDFAKKRDCAYCILVSAGHRTQAHTFYEKLGFTEDVRGFRKFYDTAGQ